MCTNQGQISQPPSGQISPQEHLFRLYAFPRRKHLPKCLFGRHKLSPARLDSCLQCFKLCMGSRYELRRRPGALRVDEIGSKFGSGNGIASTVSRTDISISQMFREKAYQDRGREGGCWDVFGNCKVVKSVLPGRPVSKVQKRKKLRRMRVQDPCSAWTAIAHLRRAARWPRRAHSCSRCHCSLVFKAKFESQPSTVLLRSGF